MSDDRRVFPATDAAAFERIADAIAESDVIDLIDQGWSEEDAEAIMRVMREIWRADFDEALAAFRRQLVN